jgi:hypothetical protein
MGNLEGGSFSRGFERWMKGTLGLERLCLREFREGILEGGTLLLETLEDM